MSSQYTQFSNIIQNQYERNTYVPKFKKKKKNKKKSSLKKNVRRQKKKDMLRYETDWEDDCTQIYESTHEPEINTPK